MVKRILGVLSYVGMALVFGAVIVKFTQPDWNQQAVYAAWTGLGLVVLYVLGQWREIVDYFSQRNARYGAVAGMGVLIMLGILVAANYLSNRRSVRWDLTENKRYSLSDQSVKLLRGLTAPVKFLVFDKEGAFDRFRPRLDSYRYNSTRVEVEYIDADKRPVQTRQYNVDTYGTVVLEYMGRTERVTTDSEQDLTNALIKLLNPRARKVYFLSGHGEKDPSSSERTGYSGITDALKRDNYAFDKLVLAQTNLIPMDATVLIIAGPRTDLLEQEVPLLSQLPVDEHREASGHAGSSRQPQTTSPDAKADRAPQRVGHHCKPVGHRGPEWPHLGGDGTCGRASLSCARDHRGLRARDDVPARARHDAGDRRA